MPAAPQPESQEDILDAALAGLTDADIPPDDEAWTVADPDCGRLAELADLTTAELAVLAGGGRDAPAVRSRPAWTGPDGAGLGGFAGFAQDEVLDLLAPGCRWPGSPTARTLSSPR